jgi:hypothetical protein
MNCAMSIYDVPPLTSPLVAGIIAVLSKLLKTDPSTKFAYLCDARVQHVAKMSREGEN